MTRPRRTGSSSEEPTRPELERFFFLDDVDRDLIALRRTQYHQLGFALQMCTVRYIMTPGVSPGREALTRSRLVHVDQYYLLLPARGHHRHGQRRPDRGPGEGAAVPPRG
nr:DUF4158 domain-containing protein [Frankia sp. ArI3]